MNRKFINRLSAIHDRINWFSPDDFERRGSSNILNVISQQYYQKELNYLSEFYSVYSNGFTYDNRNEHFLNTDKGKDLPYIGRNVLKTGRARFIFYFSNSLTKPKYLSATMLSPLWNLNDRKAEQFFSETKFWQKHRYFESKRQIGLSHNIIENVYVTDASRSDNPEVNQWLFYQELKLFNPENVYCFGSNSQKIIGLDHPHLKAMFLARKFPSYRNKKK